MTSKIKRWGNSMAIRIPRSVVAEAGWREGQSVNWLVRNGQAVVAPVARKEYRLEDFVKRITKKNRHPDLWPADKPRGTEIW